MSDKKSTPLHKSAIEGHHCTVELRLEKLGMVPFFEGLSEEELTTVEKKFSATHFAVGDAIYFQDESATMLRVVVYGAVKLVRHTPEGKDVLLDILKPGEYFGNLSASDSNTYTETARAQTDTCILSMRIRDFRSLLDQHPNVAISVLDITADRLQSSQKKIRHLTTLAVKNRIAHILMMLCGKFGEDSKHGKLLQLTLSRKDLADMTGTSTETASRIMREFQNEGIITSGRQWVAVKDPDKLKKAAEE